jgi:hypothetical protein
MVEADAKMHWSNFLSESRFVQALLHYDNNVGSFIILFDVCFIK